MDAAARWSRSLAEWALPDEILAAATESPWAYHVGTFQGAAQRSLSGPPTPTSSRVAEALGEGGTLLDVGCGSGAASLPVAASTSRIVALDESQAMLDAFVELAPPSSVVEARLGRWPDVAGEIEPVDVVVCAHVAYNVAELGPFVAALHAHARRRVVLELTALHPQTELSPLWERLWGLQRPTQPTADDAAAVISEALGLEPSIERWQRPNRHHDADAGPDADADADADADDLTWLRRRLCLPVERETELRAALADIDLNAPTELVTLWWQP